MGQINGSNIEDVNKILTEYVVLINVYHTKLFKLQYVQILSQQ